MCCRGRRCSWQDVYAYVVRIQLVSHRKCPNSVSNIPRQTHTHKYTLSVPSAKEHTHSAMPQQQHRAPPHHMAVHHMDTLNLEAAHSKNYYDISTVGLSSWVLANFQLVTWSLKVL